MTFIPGKLYEVTEHVADGWDILFSFNTNLSQELDDKWISVPSGEIVMWIGLVPTHWNNQAYKVLYKHYGLCAIEAIWDIQKLGKKLKLVVA